MSDTGGEPLGPVEAPAHPSHHQHAEASNPNNSSHDDSGQHSCSPDGAFRTAEQVGHPAIVHPTPASSNADSLLRSPILTLEDGIDMTAHSMGLSAEQDTHLLASFQSVMIDKTNKLKGDAIQVS